MIYTKLDYLPYKITLEILETGNVSLLSDEDTPIEELNKIWDKLYLEFMDIKISKDDDLVLKYTKEVYYFEAKYKLVLAYCKILAFEYDEETFNELRSFGYKLNKENYVPDLERVEKEAEGLLLRAEKFREQIPKPKENGAKSTVDDMFAAYSAILQIDFDYNTVSTTKTIALGKQIDAKIEALKSQNHGK